MAQSGAIEHSIGWIIRASVATHPGAGRIHQRQWLTILVVRMAVSVFVAEEAILFVLIDAFHAEMGRWLPTFLAGIDGGQVPSHQGDRTRAGRCASSYTHTFHHCIRRSSDFDHTRLNTFTHGLYLVWIARITLKVPESAPYHRVNAASGGDNPAHREHRGG